MPLHFFSFLIFSLAVLEQYCLDIHTAAFLLSNHRIIPFHPELPTMLSKLSRMKSMVGNDEGGSQLGLEPTHCALHKGRDKVFVGVPALVPSCERRAKTFGIWTVKIYEILGFLSKPRETPSYKGQFLSPHCWVQFSTWNRISLRVDQFSYGHPAWGCQPRAP